jgi:pyruvate,water dikinase
VTTVYSKLLAELRWCFVALEDIWLQSGILKETGDIFFLEFEEIRSLIEGSDDKLLRQVAEIVRSRRDTFTEDSRLNPLPLLVYGNTPPAMLQDSELWNENKSAFLKGIAASPGQVEGKVKVVRGLEDAEGIDKETILVVPYTDSGWAPLLARAGGLIAEVGGRLSHGAIVAREYGIPAVMDVHNATWLLQDGQWVRLDGYRGTVEMANDLRPR